MKAYQAVALDVIQITHPRYTWVNENFEILSSRFVWDKSGSTPVIAVELDLAQTDPTIYAWSIAEELTPQGYAQPSNVGNSVCVPPNGLTLYSGPATIINGIDFPSTITYQPSGVYTNSLYATWQTPKRLQQAVQGGIRVETQWQLAGASWLDGIGAGKTSVNSLFITGVSVGSQYNIQIRAVNCAGVPSAWVQAGPEAISTVLSPFHLYNGVPVAPTGTLTAQFPTSGGTQITVNAFTPFVYPKLCTPSPAVLTGLNPSHTLILRVLCRSNIRGRDNHPDSHTERIELPEPAGLFPDWKPGDSGSIGALSTVDLCGTKGPFGVRHADSGLRQQHQHRGRLFRVDIGMYGVAPDAGKRLLLLPVGTGAMRVPGLPGDHYHRRYYA